MNRQLAAVLRSSLLLIAFTALTTLSAVGAHAESRPTSIPMRGMPTIGDAGVERTIDDIMREENLHAGEAPTMRLMPEHELFDRSHAPQNPASPAVASIPPMSLAQQLQLAAKPFASPFASHAVGTNFTATNLAGTGSFPPDNDGAVGPTQYVCAVNGRIISFNKTTGLADGVLNANIDTFFSSVRNASSTSDPMCRYDRLSGRWFVSIINVSTPNRWLLAVSDAASNGVLTAGTVWTFYFFVPATVAPAISNGSTCLTDYPSLGVDANALYMGGDEFCGTGQPFQQTDVFVIRKSSVLSGGPIVVTAFRGLMTATGGYVGPFAPRGVDNEDPSTNEGYFVGADGATYGTLYMNRVTNPGGTPTLSANIPITIPTTAEPRPVPHPGNTGGYWGRLDALDTRLFHAVMRGQQLWTSHNVGVNNAGVSSGVYTSDTRVGSRWYQINVPVSSGAPSITQSGTVFTASASNDSLQKNYFIPSISVSGQGHAVMGVCSAGQNDFINAAAVGRLASDPLGTMQSPVAVTTQTSFTYNPAGNPGGISAGQPRRWGDYSTTTLDPVDDMSMWTVEQFADANNSYGVRVARILAPPPATPSALANVTAGQSAVILTLTGVSSNGSGFYDPGANLAAPAKPFNHLSANCTAGAATGTPPTITSVTYVNPTTLTVVFNATSATANLAGQNYTISVTNPDGQVASSAIVHVVSGVADTQAPVATLTSPAGGESWNVGSVHNITWTATDDVGVSAIDLALSTDGGATFPTAIATGIANSGTSAWTVPQVLSSTARVRVTAHDAAGNIAADSSHTNFTTTGWTIVASAGANGSISPNGSTIVGDGATPTYTITGAPGFGVTDVLVNNISVGAVTSYPFAAVHANQTISATFAVRTYTVTLATSGSGTAAASPNQPNYNYGANVSLTATPAGSAVFTGWTGDTTTTTNPLALVITRDRSLSANFAWPITASAGSGGSISPNGVTNVVTGGSQAYAITANSGFQISSVTVDGSSVGAVSTFTFTNVTASHTIAAAFSAVSTGSAYPMISGNYLEQFGDIANWTNNFAAGIGATYWHSVAVNATGTIPDGVKTTTSTATFSTGTTGGVQKGTGTINLLSTGTTDNSTADALDVFLDFTGVTAGKLSYDFAEVNNGTGNRNGSLRAYTSTDGVAFTELPAAGVLNFTNNVAFSQSIANVPLPASFTNSATARVRFYYHNGSGGTTGSRPKASIDNVAVTGTPIVSNFTITASAGANGSISPSGAVSVASGGAQSFTITPATHYHVADVLVDGVSVGAVTSYSFTNVVGNHTIATSFAINSHSLTVNVVGGGSVQRSPNQSAYDYGTPVTLTATPTAGDAFVGWGGDTATSANPLSFIITSNRSYTATFADTAAPVVTVTAPNGGEVLNLGTHTNLTWSASDNAAVTTIDLFLSRAGAAGPFDSLASNQPNSGTFDWLVTGPTTTAAFLKVVAHDAAGNTGSDFSDSAFHIVGATGVDDGLVKAFALSSVVPNPSHGIARLGFALPRAVRVHVGILDVQGREVLTLADGEYAAGRHPLAMATGHALAPGLYFVRMTVPNQTFVKRFAVMK